MFLINYYLINKIIEVMTKITKDEVNKVAHLARLELNEDEINNHAKQLEKILEYIQQLKRIDTNNIPPTTRAIEVINVLRKDKEKNSDFKTKTGKDRKNYALSDTNRDLTRFDDKFLRETITVTAHARNLGLQ